MLRIGLDLRGSEPGFKSHFGRGTGRYVRSLVAALQSRPYEGITFVPFGQADVELPPWQARLLRATPAGKVTLETQIFLPRRIAQLGVDLYHFFSHGDAPARLREPYVVTVLDLIPLRFPELYKSDALGLRFRLARFLELQSIRNARGIITISEASKRDIVEILNVNPDRIYVTPLAADGRFSAPTDRVRSEHLVREKHKLDPRRPILLYVGGIDPRKNVPFLLDCFHQLVTSVNDLTGRPSLVLVGRYDLNREYPALREQIRLLGLQDDVVLAGHVSDDELPKYLAAAVASVFPSLYEGFGLPVLESMAAGRAVVAASNSSIPEVVGTDYPLVGDGNREEWVRAMHRILSDAVFRESLETAGVSRARKFSWEATASLTVEAYRAIAARDVSSYAHGDVCIRTTT